ncbi:hypothetical protein K7X08_018371 [Anisodus acutangulus]|uniref:Large ribosomal subunit protein bL12 C-terminal domain-containing protein n=1 Tax=Anisodus acutangulus TaxID=402998 RepID=A0A9Q1R8U8_9SOLA|nr:hypothetical protein K7X08_018371 [Anisodus acutangulus]
MGIEEMPVMAMMMPGMGFSAGGMKGKGAGAGGKAEEKAEKTVFDLKLEGGFDAGSKIKIIKEVRSFTDLGLKEAKDLVEKAPISLKKGVTKEEGEKIIVKMKAVPSLRWKNLQCPRLWNTPHALFAIGRTEAVECLPYLSCIGLYAGFYPAVLGSTISWGLYFFFYSKAKQRYLRNREELSPSPCFSCRSRSTDALRTIIKEEGWRALYKGLMPGLFLVTHGAIQFTAYEEFRKVLVSSKAQENENTLATAAELLTLNSDGVRRTRTSTNWAGFLKLMVEMRKCYPTLSIVMVLVQKHEVVDYATLGASSKLAAILTTYPFQVVRSRLQQRPSTTGAPRYMDSWHVVKETASIGILY